MSDNKNKSAEFSFLGRMMNKLDNSNSMKVSLIFLAIVCLILFLCDFTYKKYGHYHIEELQGFYGLCGFAIFSFIIFSVKVLKLLINRPENFYSSKAIDHENYPESQIEKVDHDSN